LCFGTLQVAPERASSKNTLRINSQALGSFRGGSLPNVSAGAPTVKTASRSTESAKTDDVSHSHTNIAVHSHRESRTRSPGGPIRRPQDRKHDTSPYSAGPFLSPPPDTSWRRTNSDSALHQSAMQGINNERNDKSNNLWMMPTMNGPDGLHDGRPKSSCEVPRVPGINIYPSVHEPGTIQIPIGNNTGSLPDLTSVHFPSPIPTPLDHDGDQGSSPFSSSPVNTSPSTLSPTSLQHGIRQATRFHYTNPPSPHHHQSLPLDKSIAGLDGQDYTQLGNVSGLYHQQQQQQQKVVPPSSPSPTLQQVAGYRSPRPSPQSSPGLGGHHSAPCSPGAPSPLPNDFQLFNQAAQLQQHFEQFSMMDTPVSNVTYTEQTPLTQTHSQILPDGTGMGQIELAADAGYYSTSPQFAYNAAPSPSLRTTPNTPTSIPDITLTDFSAGDEMNRNDLAFSKQLELLDNDSLRADLEPLDFDGFQILSETGMNLIPDSVEDHFRLDRS
ncbi:hypothetical protein AMK59_5473, partial [Oryctes borbonicus]